MTFEDFKKKHKFKNAKCKCCAFCKFYKPNLYDSGGRCCHPDLDRGDDFRIKVLDFDVLEFNICDKFED